MKMKIIGKIVLTLMLAACSTQRETTTATHHTAFTTATPSPQGSTPPPNLSLPSTPNLGGAY